GLITLQSISGTTEWPVNGDRSDESSAGPQTRDQMPRRRNGWIAQVILGLLILIVASAAGSLYYLDRQFAGKIYPNISVRGIQIGQMNQAEARGAINERYATFLKQPVKLTYQDKVWYPTLNDLGMKLDVDSAVQTALGSGRSHGF